MVKLFFVSMTASQLKKFADVEYMMSWLTDSIIEMLLTTS